MRRLDPQAIRELALCETTEQAMAVLCTSEHRCGRPTAGQAIWDAKMAMERITAEQEADDVAMHSATWNGPVASHLHHIIGPLLNLPKGT